jgi:hypothetical protein
MTYQFGGTPEEQMRAFFDHLARAREPGPNADREFREALVCLVGFFDRQAHATPVATEQLRQFWHDACRELEGFARQVAVYAQTTFAIAEGANDDEWYELCLRRSVIQLLVEQCGVTAAGGAIQPGDLAELDMDLRRIGREQGPVPEPFIPKGLPDSHWWWRYPSPGAEAKSQ